MPDQVIPITQLDQIGLVSDTPPVALPPNAFSDVQNVRFKDGAVRKMEGEVNIFPNLFDSGTNSYDGKILKYVAWWPNPNLTPNNSGYYIVIVEEGDNDVVYVFKPGASADNVLASENDTPASSLFAAANRKGSFTRDVNAAWQHTFFQGGFAVIINNGLDAPQYIIDTDGNEEVGMIPNFAPLPGWESYNVQDPIVAADTFDAVVDEPIFDTQRATSIFTNYNLLVTIRRGDDLSENTFTSQANVTGALATIAGLSITDATTDNTNFAIQFTGLQSGDVVTIMFESKTQVTTRCGVIRAFGDFLVAGNLTERLTSAGTPVIRNLSGIIRTSDVAAPGSIPTNWNPFAVGVSTADEFVLTATGIVQDMVELQGNLYIYSNTSISVMRQTGNAAVPLAVTPVTESYGAQTTEAIVEYDGKHLVVGSQDIYLFGGHPGSIQSVADQRIRRYFFDRLNPLHNHRMFCLRYPQRDEIWVCYPSTASARGECDEALIWNYRQNIWTKRTLTNVVSGDVGPVPGGGLPTSTSSLSGTSGDNTEDTAGATTIYDIDWTSTSPDFRIEANSGEVTRYTGQVGDVPQFLAENIVASYTIGENFNSGPVFNELADGRTFETEGISFIGNLLGTRSGDILGQHTVVLPRFLYVDQPFDAEVVYYSGQTVLLGDDIYRVRSDIPGGSVPTTLYIPSEGDEMYGREGGGIYENQGDEDFSGLTPADLPDYWELVPGGTAQTTTTIAAEIAATLTADEGFNRIFSATSEGPVLTVHTRGISGRTYTEPDGTESSYPVYTGATIQFESPVTNGGNSDHTMARLDASELSALGLNEEEIAPSVTFNSNDELYIPFDIENPTTTGIFSGRNEMLGSEDEIVIFVTGDYTSSDQAARNTQFAAALVEGINEDPEDRWTASASGGGFTLVSNNNNRYIIDDPEFGQLPLGSDGNELTFGDITLDRTGAGLRDYGTGVTTQADRGGPEQEPVDVRQDPIWRVTPPTTNGLAERPVKYIDAGTGNQATILRGIMIEATGTDLGGGDEIEIGDFGQTCYTNWDYSAGPNGALGSDVTLTTQDDPYRTGRPAALSVMHRATDDTPNWNVELVSRGNTESNLPTDLTDVAVTSTRRQNGNFSIHHTPSYVGMLVSNPSHSSGYEFMVIELTVAMASSDHATLRDIVYNAVRDAFPRLAITQRSTPIGWRIQPANYDNLANFVLDVRLNDNHANAHWIYELATNGTDPFDPTITGVRINPASSDLFLNPSEVDDTYDATAMDMLSLRGGGPLKVQQHDMGIASLDLGIMTTLIFDVNRPWPANEINANLEYPLLASVTLIQDTDGVFHRVNKLLGADIGWSRPTPSLVRRKTEMVGNEFRARILRYDTDGTTTLDDYPAGYESYVERVHMPISPEFDTEEIASVALWTDGHTVNSLRGGNVFSRLDMRMLPSNYPGEVFDLDTVDVKRSNKFLISDDYKIDMRIHGRFTNYRLTDVNATDGLTEDDDGVATMNDINVSQKTEWRLSGMQADVKRGGHR